MPGSVIGPLQALSRGRLIVALRGGSPPSFYRAGPEIGSSLLSKMPGLELGLVWLPTWLPQLRALGEEDSLGS